MNVFCRYFWQSISIVVWNETCWVVFRSFPEVWGGKGSVGRLTNELKTGWSSKELRHQSRIVLPVAIVLLPERIVKVTLDIAIWNENKQFFRCLWFEDVVAPYSIHRYLKYVFISISQAIIWFVWYDAVYACTDYILLSLHLYFMLQKICN